MQDTQEKIRRRNAELDAMANEEIQRIHAEVERRVQAVRPEFTLESNHAVSVELYKMRGRYAAKPDPETRSGKPIIQAIVREKATGGEKLVRRTKKSGALDLDALVAFILWAIKRHDEFQARWHMIQELSKGTQAAIERVTLLKRLNTARPMSMVSLGGHLVVGVRVDPSPTMLADAAALLREIADRLPADKPAE